jgi:cytochrome P450
MLTALESRKTPDWFQFQMVNGKSYYEALAAKRADFPVEIRSPFQNAADPIITAYRYSDVIRIISDEAEFSSEIIAARYRPILGPQTMVALGHRESRPFRSLLGSALGPRNMDALTSGVLLPIIERVVETLSKRRDADLVTDLAATIPPLVIAYLLGLPPETAPSLLRDAMAAMSFSDEPKTAIRGARALRKLFRQLVEERHRKPGDDLVSCLLAPAGGEPPRDDDVVALLVLLAVAGTETAFPGIGSMFCALLTHPEQLEAVRRDPSLARAAVNETLRFESPVQATARSAVRDTHLGPVEVAAGTAVFAHLGSANHDLPGLTDPDRFDIHRPSPVPHLAFGLGAHRCIGLHLAKAEMELTLRGVLAACPGMRIASGHTAEIVGQFIRAPISLPVELS